MVFIMNKNKCGFTLLEILTAVVVIGGLAGLAIPHYLQTLEKSRAAEGIQILGILHQGQMLVKQQTGSWANDISEFDFTIPSSEYFDPPEANPANHAWIKRKGSYTLRILPDGSITCSGGPPAICAQLGF